jgi:hypothetical protein
VLNILLVGPISWNVPPIVYAMQWLLRLLRHSCSREFIAPGPCKYCWGSCDVHRSKLACWVSFDVGCLMPI